jgi:hypothetical protein
MGTGDLSTLPPALLIGLGVAVLVQVTLDVLALVDLYRRPVSGVALGNKWVWVAIIVLVNVLGAILYFAVGRRPAAQTDEAAPTSLRTKADVADALYGKGDEKRRP